MVEKGSKMEKALTLLCEMYEDLRPVQLLQPDWDALKVVISRLSESYKKVKNILDLHRIFCVVKS